MRSAFAHCSGPKRRVSSVESAWDGVVTMEGGEIPEIAERDGGSMRSRERCLEALSCSKSLYYIRVERGQVGIRTLNIRGDIGIVSSGGRVAGGQGGLPSALELVLGPLCIGFSIVFAKVNPVDAVLAQPAICLGL